MCVDDCRFVPAVLLRVVQVERCEIFRSPLLHRESFIDEGRYFGKASRIGQKVLFSVNHSKTTKPQHAGHMGYNAACDHNSEKDRLPPTKDLDRTSPPRSLPPIVRRANLMLGNGPALHTVLGVFAVFLRDNIKRLTISGMILFMAALVNGVSGLEAIYKTHTDTPLWIRSRSVRLASVAIFGTATYSAGIRLIGAYVSCRERWKANQQGDHSRVQNLRRKEK